MHFLAFIASSPLDLVHFWGPGKNAAAAAAIAASHANGLSLSETPAPENSSSYVERESSVSLKNLSCRHKEKMMID